MAMTNNVNHKNMLVMWNFLRGYAEEKGLKDDDVNIFEMLKLPFPEKYRNALSYYTDPTQWSPLETYVQCYLQTKEVTGDPDAFRNCGRSSVKYKSIANWRQIARSIGGPMLAVCYLPNAIPDWNDTKIFEIVEPPHFDIQSQEVKTTIRYTFHSHLNPCDDYCSDPHILGLLEAIPTNYPRHIYKPWETLPMGKVRQPLVQYDPLKLFSGIFFKHLDLKSFFEGNRLYITNPNTAQVQQIGRKVVLVPSDLHGNQVNLGNYRDIKGPVHDNEITGTLISETITFSGEPVCEAGVIMEAPYFIINYSFEELAITRKLWNLRCMFIGRKELLEEYFTTNNALRAEIEEKNNAYAKVKEYADHLEELVDKRTKQYREQKDVAEGLVGELKVAYRHLQETQAQLIQSDRLAAMGRMSAQISHEIRTPLQGAKSELEFLRDESIHLISIPRKIESLGYPEPFRMKLDELIGNTFKRSATVKYRNQTTIDAIAETLLDTLHDKFPKITLDECETIAAMGYEKDLADLAFVFEQEKSKEALKILKTVFDIGYSINNGVRATENQMGIINALLEHTHLDKGEIQAININKKISATLSLYNKVIREAGIKLELELDNSLKDVECNVVKLNDAYRNIIENAVQALKQVNDREKIITIKTSQDDEYVTLEIIDNGPGIPDDKLDKIYDPFYTTKKVGEGTGLGLHMVYKTIQDHRGSIQCISHAGETRFIVKLPFKYQKTEPNKEDTAVSIV